MGLRYVKGLHTAGGKRLAAARDAHRFTSVEDLIRRTGLDRGAVARLAEAGALTSLEPNRRAALWSTQGPVRRPALHLACHEPAPRFAGLDLFESITWDYRATCHSSRGHPLAPMRAQLEERGLPDAATVSTARPGARLHYAGIVICRQRPGTASGVTFMTLEDETGFINVVIWSRIFDQQAILIRTASFLGVTGKLQVEDGVIHIIAERFWDPRRRLARRPAAPPSHDFR